VVGGGQSTETCTQASHAYTPAAEIADDESANVECSVWNAEYKGNIVMTCDKGGVTSTANTCMVNDDCLTEADDCDPDAAGTGPAMCTPTDAGAHR
jgi:hypothetical protein